MKFYSLPIKALIVSFAFLILSSSAFAQLGVNVGGFLGGGTIKGDSPSLAAFTSSVFIETNTALFLEVTPRLSYIYSKDLDAVLPNTNKPYYPSMQGISFKGITTQYFQKHIFLEEGIGFLALNDHTFSTTDSWSYGIALSISGGWDLRGFNLRGFRLGAGVEYGITFNNTLAQYSSFHFHFNYAL
ncbi:hypothetical protein BMS3Abin03_01363 [bacterium BMS3Abin03]|nr:hypothetical protein BMS3Abin03_01363 [bacterium BMS3Abin03]